MFYAHNHTDGSNFKGKDSIIKTKALIDEALRLKAKGVAITDHETITNHIKAIRYFNKLKKEGKIPADFKVALGNEIYLLDRSFVENARENNGKIRFFHLILIAKNKRGHEGLRRLSSMAWLNRFHYRGFERVPTYKDQLTEIMKEYKGDIICSTACLGGELPHLFKEWKENPTNENKNKIFDFIKYLHSLFGDDLYIELQPSSNEEQIEFNNFAYKFATTYNFKPIVTTDSHYLKKEHKIFHKYYLLSQNADREVDDFYETTYMMPKEEMPEYFNKCQGVDLEVLIKNTHDIHSKIEMYDFYMEQQIPETPIKEFELQHLFKDYYDKYEYLNNYANSEHEIDRYFLYLLEEGFKEKNQDLSDEKNIARIDTEMKELWKISEKMKQHMSSYYVLTKDIIDIMWNFSLVGISRGSSSGYYTCYLLDIVQMNPLEFDLPHWRHLVAERPDLPDIDIDSQSSQRKQIIEGVKKVYEADGVRRVINCCTHTTEKARSSILTACRGLDIDSDISQNIANMIPNSSLTLTQCFYGDAEEGIKPVPGLIDELKKHEGLFEIVEMFEGLISGRSVHTSGVFILNNGIDAQNAIMTSSSGTLVTQFNYDDSVYFGCLKLDFLSTAALEKIRGAMDLLIEHGKMEWKGSLRETYKAYIHPDVLDFDSPDMYKLLYNGEILDAFQFETVQGRKAIRAVQPHNFRELMDSNSLMRLSCEGEQPIDKYVKHKKDINLWYTEMREYGLNSEEIKILEKHLLNSYGVAVTQEDVMLLVMDENISNFDIIEANKLRKAIAKANAKDIIKEVQALYFKKGLEVNTRPILLDYVWEKNIEPQLGYSFSMNHTCPYTGILVQEMNIAYRFGPIWWKTSVLCNNSGIVNGEAASGVGYGTIALAISKMKDLILPPDVNKSSLGFTPDEKNNKILFGLISIDGLGKNEVASLIANRPYTSIEDCLSRCGLTDNKKITLIKSGALDSFNPNRREILIDFIKNTTPLASKLTMMQLPKLLPYVPKELEDEVNLYKLKAMFKQFKKDEENVFIPNTYEKIIFSMTDLTLNQIDFENSDLKINIKLFNKSFEKSIVNLRAWLSKPETLELFNRLKLREAWTNNCLGTKESWEMETTVFYHDKHELDFFDLSLFNLRNFNELPEEPEFVVTGYTKTGKEKRAVKLYTIAGTVIDKIKGKDRFVVLTQYGPVTVKITKNEFLKYDKKVVQINGKNKTVLDESWLTRGTKLIISGYRNKDDFKAKSVNKDYPIAKIFGKHENNKPAFTLDKMV